MLEAAYNDAPGVTAEFNRNVLHVVNRELGADFDPDGFEHVAFFDAEREWIEMRLRARARAHGAPSPASTSRSRSPPARRSAPRSRQVHARAARGRVRRRGPAAAPTGGPTRSSSSRSRSPPRASLRGPWPETGPSSSSPTAPSPARAPSSPSASAAASSRRLRENLTKTRRALSAEVQATLFDELDEETWERLEEALIAADVGARTTASVVERLEHEATEGGLSGGEALSGRLVDLLADAARPAGDATASTCATSPR